MVIIVPSELRKYINAEDLMYRKDVVVTSKSIIKILHPVLLCFERKVFRS